MAKVSVIVPVYNVQDYVEECIKSILNQTLADFEVICIDDGSKDNSGKILDRLAQMDRRIRVIHKENTGYGNTVNVGLKQAKGEYIAIIESDDFIENNMLMELSAIADEYELDYVKSNHWAYSGKGRELIDTGGIREYNRVILRYESMNKILSCKSIWAGLYRKKFLEDNQIYFLETPGASYQDISFWFKVCIMAQRGYFTRKAYVNYRVDNSNSSVKSREKVFCVCDEMEECERYLLGTDLDIEYIYPYFVISKSNAFTWNIRRILPEHRQKFAEKASEDLRADICGPYMKKMGASEWKMTGISEWDINEMNLLMNFPESYLKYEGNEFVTITMENRETVLAAIMNEKEIYIYGAGKNGQRLSKYISNSENDCCIKYVVTALKGGEADINSKVLEIKNEKLNIEKKIIVTVANNCIRKEMVIRAMNRGFKSIFLLDNEIIQFLRRYEDECNI